METGENSVLNLIEKSSNGLTNNNSVQLNGSPTSNETFDASTNSAIHKDIEFSDSIELQTDIQKPNVFELIGGNKNCDSELSDCSKKIVLNNNDLAIGFVDDDDIDDDKDETNGESKCDTATSNHCDLDEASKGHENNIG